MRSIGLSTVIVSTLLYIPTLAFLDYYAPINVYVFVECDMWEIFGLFPSYHNGSSLSVLIQSHYLLLVIFVPSKSKRRDV